MTKLKQILLVGTLLPALAIPLAPVSAQVPDDHRPHGQRPDGAPRGGQHPEGAAPHGERAGNPEDRHGGQPGGAANRAGEPPHNRRQAEQPGAAPNPNHQPPAQRAQNRNDGGDDAGKPRTRRDAAERHPGTQPDRTNPAAPERAQNRDDRGPRNAGAGERRDDRGPRNAGAGERHDDRGPHDVGAGERRDDRGPHSAGAGERRDDRGPRNAGAGERRDDRGPRDVGAGERRDDRGPRDVGAGERRDDRGPRDVGASDRPNDPRGGDRRPGGPAVVVGGAPVGFLAPTGARRLDDIRRDRREVRDGDRVFIREPGRTIVQQNGRAFIVHDENARFRDLGLNARRDRRGNEFIDTVVRPGGIQIITYTDVTGRLLRRVRRTADGREFVLIDNGNGSRIQRYEDDVVVLPPPPLRIPRDRYVVDYRGAEVGVLYDTLIAPPLAAPPRRYTLDQIRYSPDVRNYVRSIDINTINFDSGSWDVPAAATGQLQALGNAIKRAVERNPNSVFLIEGYTDATGNPDDNLSLSDRRAQSVAEILSKDFGVPPENLTSQGYGQQNPKEQTNGPSAANRRVVVRNITQLLASGDQPPGQ